MIVKMSSTNGGHFVPVSRALMTQEYASPPSLTRLRALTTWSDGGHKGISTIEEDLQLFLMLRISRFLFVSGAHFICRQFSVIDNRWRYVFFSILQQSYHCKICASRGSCAPMPFIESVTMWLLHILFSLNRQSSRVIPSNLQDKPHQIKNLNVSCLVLQLSLPNPLRPGVRSIMKM